MDFSAHSPETRCAELAPNICASENGVDMETSAVYQPTGGKQAEPRERNGDSSRDRREEKY